MSILSGFKKIKRYNKESNGYKLLSHWTSSDTVEVSTNGQTLTNALGYKADLINGLVPASQLPSYVDDVLEGTAQNVSQTGAGTYSATGFILSGESEPCTPEEGKTYVDVTSNIQYRWSGHVYVSLGSNLVLGESSTTAYRGDRGASMYLLLSNATGNIQDQLDDLKDYVDSEIADKITDVLNASY